MKISDLDINPLSTDTKIYKDVCTFCENTNFHPGGLYICLKSFHAFCEDHIKDYAESSGSTVYVHVESAKVPEKKSEREGEPIPKITKLAIGSEGGFDNDKFQLVDLYHIVVYPNIEEKVKITQELGEKVYKVAHHVETCTSAERLEMLSKASNAWDGEIKLISKHSETLQQLDSGKIVPMAGWRCEAPDCDLTDNLWLNLSDGAIRCGRSQFLTENTLTVGNNHMKQYYDTTGFPLVVKLGTISPDETADVYSYDEDDAVIDTQLRKHLAHWGLDMDKMRKTERSTLELEVDLNQHYEWARCVEDGATLEHKFGPGYTGLINIGSSCYINSVVQALLLLPSIRTRFHENAKEEFNRVPLNQVHSDFNAQVAKLISSMMSGRFSTKELEDKNLNGIKPKQFKSVVAEQHQEFRTAQQQDAEEYLRYLLERISNSTPPGVDDPTTTLKFKMETRFEDVASGMVRYTDKEEVVLGIPVHEELMCPMEKKEGETELRFHVSLEELIRAAFSPSHIEGFKSPITGETKGATTTLRFKTFPDFLVLQIQKFTMTPDFKQRKFDMDLQVEDILDLSSLKGTGKKSDEVLLPEDVEATVGASLPDYDKNIAQQLQQMGFSENASIRAAIEVRASNGGTEQAMEWLLPRLDDPSINEPVQPMQAINKKAAAERPCVQELVGFGFSTHQACYALNKFQDVNQAAEWLFEHAAEVPPEEPASATSASTTEARQINLPDGDGVYRLVGFISHMGSTPHSGHYVAHLLKDDQWILFNDEKVAISQNPPRQLGYLYIFQRI